MPTANQWIINRAPRPAVAFETTILTHGLPTADALQLADELNEIAGAAGVNAATVGILRGSAIVGLSNAEVRELIQADTVIKTNTANLGLVIHSGGFGATTVSTTIELAAAAGLRVFSTGGIGGVHEGVAEILDISADLLALSRHPVVTVASGCKNILDIRGTRELLETLGVPVIGYRCDSFPAFYQRETDMPIDGRFDDIEPLASYLRVELARSGRGVLVVNPIPREAEIPLSKWEIWLAEARASTPAGTGRDATPALLTAVHTISKGETIRANLSLARSNAALASELAAAMGPE